MFWNEDDSADAPRLPDDIVDLLFAIDCKRLPVDHQLVNLVGWPDAAALVREFGGMILVDGMLTSNLPVQAAREMGADVIIAVNVGTPLLKRNELSGIFGVTEQMISILAEQNVEETLSLPTSIVGDASSFILRVRGESMVNAGIYDGDYIVVKEQKDAHNGEIVVALIDDSATVKTFYREKNRIRLQPENDTMSPIYADNPVILGKVTALIRSIS